MSRHVRAHAAVFALCCALCLAFIPAAVGRPAREKAAGSSPASTPASASVVSGQTGAPAGAGQTGAPAGAGQSGAASGVGHGSAASGTGKGNASGGASKGSANAAPTDAGKQKRSSSAEHDSRTQGASASQPHAGGEGHQGGAAGAGHAGGEGHPGGAHHGGGAGGESNAHGAGGDGHQGGAHGGGGRERGEGRSAHGKHARQDAAQPQQGGAQPAARANAQLGTAEAQQDSAAARSSNKGSGNKKKHSGKTKQERKERKESKKGKTEPEPGEPEQPEGKTEPEQPHAPAVGGSSQPTLTNALIASAPAGAPTQTTPASQPGPPSVAARKLQAGGGSSAAYRRAHTHRANGGAPLGAALTVPAGALPAAAAPGARHAPRSAARSKSAHGRPSPLVTTITKIVDVVPVAVRALIAALLVLALALAVRSRLSVLRARRLERQRAELLDDVGLLQAALLPQAPARLGPVGTSVAYQPAAGPGAGGDFYDVFALENGQLAVIIGDVSGHGRQALPHTALVRFTLRAYLEAGLSPREALQTAGAVLERQLRGAFATVLAATYQPRERVLVYASAGHPPPIVLGSQPGARSLPAVTVSTSPPIGVGMRTGTRQTVVSLPGRAHICFYTDGVTESRVGSELFGASRLVDALSELGPSADAPALLALVAQRADARPDDMAACVLSVEGHDDAPRVLLEELELDRSEVAGPRAERFLRACGLERDDVAHVIDSAHAAVGRNGTVVLDVRRQSGTPRVAVRREHLTYLHARRAHAHEVAG
jgi:Stage II sporulation protein E (SpoIIE)